MTERFNRTIQDKTRTIVIATSLPAFLWAEILRATDLLRNITPVTNLSCTPFEKGSFSPAYQVWDYEKQKVYNAAAPAFDKVVDPCWWQGAAGEPEEEELLPFPVFIHPPAAPSAPVSEVINISPEQDMLRQMLNLHPHRQRRSLNKLPPSPRRCQMQSHPQLQWGPGAAQGKIEEYHHLAWQTCT